MQFAMGSIVKLSPSYPGLRNKNFLISMLWPIKYQNKRKSTSINAIESFTNGLVYKNKLKWESVRNNFLGNNNKTLSNINLNDFDAFQWANLVSQSFLNDIDCMKSPKLDINVKKLSRDQLDTILMDILKTKAQDHLIFLINQCLKFKQFPSDNITILILKFLSIEGKIELINQIEKVLREINNPLLKIYPDFNEFKGLAYWKTNNLDESLRIFESIYLKKCSHERKILLHEIFRLITNDTFNNKGEAALVRLTHTAKEIYEQHDDIYLMACIWKDLFCSKYYTDQNLAMELIEQYIVLQKAIADKSVTLCSLSLRQHNIENVYRLIQLYLKYNEHEACKNCMHMLFDYQYFRRDLQACIEISKTCSELDMPLNQIQMDKFLKLLLNQPSTPISLKKLKQNKFVYKF